MMEMRVKGSVVITLFVLLCLSTLGSSRDILPTLRSTSSQDFDFYYFVQQWPGAYCGMDHGCCYPTTGKPDEDFNIRGLWPSYNSGDLLENCSNNSLDPSEISDLKGSLQKDWPSLACPSSDGTEYWADNWKTYGTCSGLHQRSYFIVALYLKNKANLLKALENAGIHPGGFYSTASIRKAIYEEVGYEPYIQCKINARGNIQLYQVHLCVDKYSYTFIECPVFPTRGKCSDIIEFLPFDEPYLRLVTNH